MQAFQNPSPQSVNGALLQSTAGFSGQDDGVDIELGHDLGTVFFDRFYADAQQLGDLLVQMAFGQEL